MNKRLTLAVGSSALALLLQSASAQVYHLEELWNIPAAPSGSFIATGSTERGAAYNPVTKNVYVVSRNGGLNIGVFRGSDGTQFPNLDMTGIPASGAGTYPVNMIGVANDGAIYVGNLTTDTAGAAGPFRLYRWANESAAPVQVYAGDPLLGAGAGAPSANWRRFGDTIDVRGEGLSAQILLGARGGGNVSVLTTADGVNFTAGPAQTGVAGSSNANGPFGLGVAFGAGDTFWGKAASVPLRQMSFDLVADTGAELQSVPVAQIPETVTVIGYDPERNLIAGIDVVTGVDSVRLYSAADFSLLDSKPMPADYASSTGTGSLDFGDGMLFALDANNGLVAYAVVPEPATFALAAGLGLLGLAGWRRLRR